VRRPQRLGAGRSGEVWLVDRPDGPVALKIFGGDGLADVVHYAVSGAPNPYAWDEDAVRTALARRTVVRSLAQLWFGDRLRVSAAYDIAWDDERRAWALATEPVDGAPVRLLHPLRDSDTGLGELRERVMRPLQERLLEAGLDGVVWQAGKGNPVALDNFLQVGAGRFAVIDVESGVPALFPLSPVALLRFYLPRAVRYRHPMFDDVDVRRLRAYVDASAGSLHEGLGADGWRSLRAAVDDLARHQERWHAKNRVERAVTSQRVRGRLSDAQADHYLRHRWRFRVRRARWASVTALDLLTVTGPTRLGDWLLGIGWTDLLRGAWGFVSSQDYRTGLASRHVERRVQAWRERGQLSGKHAGALLDELQDEGASTYLTDFGAHLGLKATFQVFELTLFTFLVAVGLLPLWVLGVVLALDGVLYRTAYTLYRSVREVLSRRALPWVALLVGLLPLLGSLAFPAQMLWSAKEREELVARFLVVDLFTRLGAKVPVWGGPDTLTEHLLNRVGSRLVRRGALT
jgi:hypothetical protein